MALTKRNFSRVYRDQAQFEQVTRRQFTDNFMVRRAVTGDCNGSTKDFVDWPRGRHENGRIYTCYFNDNHLVAVIDRAKPVDDNATFWLFKEQQS